MHPHAYRRGGDKSDGFPQVILLQDLAEWRKIWCRPDVQPDAPWRHAPLKASTLTPLTAQDIWTAARSFSSTTSVGCDGFPPRALADLSTPLRDCIAQFLNLAEQTGKWPSSVEASLIHLIPKPEGGRRPIGVLPSIVRVWERARKETVQRWVGEHARSYDWATQGRSSEGAVWYQSLVDEGAAADGHSSATVLMDLSKAFEMVSLQKVWEAGVRHRFPLHILRLVLESFAFARHLTYQGAISEGTLTLSAVLAGGGFAQVAL